MPHLPVFPYRSYTTHVLENPSYRHILLNTISTRPRYESQVAGLPMRGGGQCHDRGRHP